MQQGLAVQDQASVTVAIQRRVRLQQLRLRVLPVLCLGGVRHAGGRREKVAGLCDVDGRLGLVARQDPQPDPRLLDGADRLRYAILQAVLHRGDADELEALLDARRHLVHLLRLCLVDDVPRNAVITVPRLELLLGDHAHPDDEGPEALPRKSRHVVEARLRQGVGQQPLHHAVGALGDDPDVAFVLDDDGHPLPVGRERQVVQDAEAPLRVPRALQGHLGDHARVLPHPAEEDASDVARRLHQGHLVGAHAVVIGLSGVPVLILVGDLDAVADGQASEQIEQRLEQGVTILAACQNRLHLLQALPGRAVGGGAELAEILAGCVAAGEDHLVAGERPRLV
mmetsp:Transcript_24137/g.72500  ORF Transcript_24137/g.72500 Transcript_24137/m.72500 type:complete len:340 (+) Transcript_24137:1102-2121(+)